jgi:ribonucleoside-diphosphate reductase alpha chain
MIDFDDILKDLELKRAAARPADEHMRFDIAGALSGLPADPPITIQGPGGPTPFAAAVAAGLVTDALATIALARGADDPVVLAAPLIIRDAVHDVQARLDALEDGASITAEDLSSLVEAALIRGGRHEVATALVMRRAAPAGARPAPSGPRVIRRSGHIVDWRESKIEVAIRKAFLSHGADPSPATAIAARVTERTAALGAAYVPIETVQDIVQEELVMAGHMRVAERYILYRAERAMLRARDRAPASADLGDLPVTEPDGSAGTWDADDLRARIRFAAVGLDLPFGAERLEAELRRSLHPGIGRRDLQRVVVMNARSLVERDAEFARFAARILLSHVYEETLDWRLLRDGIGALRDAHRRGLRASLERGAAAGRIDPALLDYDLDLLAGALDPSADLDFDFLGVQTLYDRYLMTDKTDGVGVRTEAPQIFWMRVAMGVCLGEAEDRERRAIDLYTAYKERRFCSSTPTLFNAGTTHPQLSSCYVYVVDDSLESIVQRGIADNAMCSKWAGGLGGSWTRVRGTGSHIRGTNGESQGVVPFLKLHNDQLVAVNQGGKRAGSGCAYLEIWHNDIREFLELRRTTGDERRRTHEMNTAAWIPDLFMKRMEAREDWTLFRSSDVPDLHDLYGSAFEARYEEYERLAAAGGIHGERIAALDLWKQLLRMLFETGHPWITFKDPCNLRSPQDHAGVVHSSNLCTEITLNTSAEETAVCNLGSVLIDQHLDAAGEFDHPRLRDTVRVAVRALDDVIDVNFYPTEAAALANARHRPVGLGVMGLQYALYRRGIAFDSPEALEFNDRMMEAIAFYAYEASSDLAAERGRYASYAGSKWDCGLLPQDTLDLLEAERGEPVDVPRGGLMDWAPLRERIAAQGMRNSNVLAIAPTATIANIMGTSPCIEPLYKNLFAKSNLSGDFTFLNPFLVRDLKAEGIWSADLADQIKYFDGDLREVEGIPEAIRRRYPTAFDLEADWLIDAAARRAKWIDQSQSLNLFLGSPDMRSMSHMYRRAWRAGLKTTYYLRTLGASAIEKATVSSRTAQADPPAGPACDLSDPSCEACQ